jgi:hypothetical protein
MTEILVAANEQELRCSQQPKVPRAHQHRHFPSSSRGGVPRRVSEAAQVVPSRLLTGSLLLFLWWRSSTRAGLFCCSSTRRCPPLDHKQIRRWPRWQPWPRCIYSLFWRCTLRTTTQLSNFYGCSLLWGCCTFAAAAGIVVSAGSVACAKPYVVPCYSLSPPLRSTRPCVQLQQPTSDATSPQPAPQSCSPSSATHTYAPQRASAAAPPPPSACCSLALPPERACYASCSSVSCVTCVSCRVSCVVSRR